MKPSITDKFQDLDGTIIERDSMAGLTAAMTLVFARTLRILDRERSNAILLPGINAYNRGEYREALRVFEKATQLAPSLEAEISPHMEVCRRVLRTELHPPDLVYEAKVVEWKSLPVLTRWLSQLIGRREPAYQVRCKYCGHYTPYIHPNDGMAYLGSNNCYGCGRGYPVPDFGWDSVDGQAYIYYRGSVSEYLFYKEFEWRYRVNPRVRIAEGKWTFERVDDPEEGREGALPSSTEDWGRWLGKQWAKRLAPEELKTTYEALMAEDRPVSDLLPADLAEERSWYLSDLAKLWGEDDIDRMEFDMGVEDALMEEAVAKGTELWNDHGEHEDATPDKCRGER